MMYRVEVNPLTHCSMLLCDNYGKETIYKLNMILLFISINSWSQYGGVHTTLNRDHAHNKISLETCSEVFQMTDNKTCPTEESRCGCKNYIL